MREISVEELKKRKLKAMISCLALFGLAIYGILFSPTEHGKVIGIISSTIGLLQWAKWNSATIILQRVDELVKGNENKKEK